MKKLLTLALVLALAASALTGCTSEKDNGPAEKTPEELTQLYADAITQNGGEMVEYSPVISEVKEGDMSTMALETMGLNAEDMRAFGISMSLMNVQAYAIAAIAPAEGKTEAVMQALQGYIDLQILSFESYLPGPYEVAQNARLETLEDGTVLLVMCEDQDTVFQAISAAILAA